MYLFKFKSPQEFYDALVEKSRNNGFPAVEYQVEPSIAKSCKYRTQDGKACAIGIGIPDEVYTPRLEGHVSGFNDKVPDLLPDWATVAQLESLQQIHDNLSYLEKWSHKVFLKFLNQHELFKTVYNKHWV